jgi:hypothetical protein
MSRRRVLALSADPDLLGRITPVLARAGAEVDAVGSLDELPAGEIAQRYVFVGLPRCDVGGLDALLPRLRSNAQVAVVTSSANLRDHVRLLGDPRVNHVIVGDRMEHDVLVTTRKLLTGDIFGLEKYVPEGTEIRYLRLDDFAGRGEALREVLAHAEAHKIRRQQRGAIGQVAEELLMNALYDAPVDERGRQIFAEVEPHERTRHRSPRPVSIRFAGTPDGFALAVRDRFGRLAKNTLVAYIDKCMTAPAGAQIDRKAYGSGLGLYLIANAAATYVVNVAYDIATEAICTFDRAGREPLRLIGVFTHPGRADQLRLGPVPATTTPPPVTTTPPPPPGDAGEGDED